MSSTPSTPSSPTTSTGGGSLNPLKFNSIEDVLANIMKYLQGIAGTIAVIFIIIGGIMYMVSGGSKETTERAKKTLICAIAGLAIVLAAPLFYTEIKAILGGGGAGLALKGLLTNILKLLLAIIGFLAIISMVVGAIWMLTAVGDEDRYELGKKTAGYSILGLVIALSALIIANQVTSLVGSSSVINGVGGSPVTGGGIAGGTGSGVGAGGTGTGGIPGGSSYNSSSPLQADTHLIRLTNPGETYQLKINFNNSLASATGSSSGAKNTTGTSGASTSTTGTTGNGTNTAATNSTGIIDVTSKVTYTSSNSQIFTVDNNGLVKDVYAYHTGDAIPTTATVTMNYQSYTNTVAVEAIDQTKCVALNPTDTKPDDKRFPVVIMANGFSEQDMEKFKERAKEYANIDIPPVTTENYVVWRSDLPDKDACNFAGEMKVTIFNEAGQPTGSATDRAISIYYLSDDPESGDYKEVYGEPTQCLEHEMGHADGKFTDEYTNEDVDPAGFEGYATSMRYNCFRDDTKETSEKQTFDKICAYYKGIAPGYDCGSFDGKIAGGCNDFGSDCKANSNSLEGIKLGCNYTGAADSDGYKWYRSMDNGLMNHCGYNGETCTYGVVDEALYSAQIKKMKGN